MTLPPPTPRPRSPARPRYAFQAGAQARRGVGGEVKPGRPLIRLQHHRLAIVIGLAVRPRRGRHDGEALKAAIGGVGNIPKPRKAENVGIGLAETPHRLFALGAGPLEKVSRRDKAASSSEGLAESRRRGDGFGPGVGAHGLPVLHALLVEPRHKPPPRIDHFDADEWIGGIEGPDDRRGVGGADMLAWFDVRDRAVLEDKRDASLAELIDQARSARDSRSGCTCGLASAKGPWESRGGRAPYLRARARPGPRT